MTEETFEPLTREEMQALLDDGVVEVWMGSGDEFLELVKPFFDPEEKS